MFTKEAQELAKPCYEAIKKISKRGINPMTGAPLTVPEWKWEPKRFEHFVLLGQGEQKGTVWSFSEKTQKIKFLGDAPDQAEIDDWKCIVEYEYATPILHWERIEQVLEGMGYRVEIKDDLCDDLIGKGKKKHYLTWHFARIHGSKVKVKELIKYSKKVSHISTVPIVQDLSTESRQLAVMRAVIELGKEV